MPCLCGGGSSKVAPDGGRARPPPDARRFERSGGGGASPVSAPPVDARREQQLQQLCERQDRTLDTKPVALEEFERIEGRSAAKADQHRERAKSIMVKSRASEPSPQSPPLDDDAELSDADSF